MRSTYTDNAWVGSKYESTRGLRTKEIAALIRDEIKKTYPKYKVSVTTDLFAGGSAINVDIKKVDFPVIKTDGQNPYDKTDEAKKLIEDLQAIVQQYQFSDCDSMTDYFNVSFYDRVDFDWEYLRDLRKSLSESVA